MIGGCGERIRLKRGRGGEHDGVYFRVIPVFFVLSRPFVPGDKFP